MVKKLDPDISLESAEKVDAFVRSITSAFPAVQDHKDISSKELEISPKEKRLAYIGRLEGSSCAWFAIWDEIQSVNDLPLILGEKDTLQLCLPVERKKLKADSQPKPKLKASRRSRVESLSEMGSSKRQRSRSIKEEVDLKQEVESNSEVDLEVGEIIWPKKEVDIKEEVGSKEVGSKVGESEIIEGSKRQVRKPSRYLY